MKCVILAGGLGTRLAEETSRIPKPMVEIGGRPILWHIMKTYASYGIKDFIVCLGYRGYVVKEYFANYYLHGADVTFDLGTGGMEIIRSQSEPWRVSLIETGANSMTGGRLKRVLPLVHDDEAFCLTYGDGVGNVDIKSLLAFHKDHGKLATVTAVAPAARFGRLEMDGTSVRDFSEKPDDEGGLINGGFFVLSPKVGRYLQNDDTIWEQAPLRGLAADDELRAFQHRGFWKPMDTLRDRQQLEEMWDSGDAPWKVWV